MTEDISDNSGPITFTRRKRGQSGVVLDGQLDRSASEDVPHGPVVCKEAEGLGRRQRSPSPTTTVVKKTRVVTELAETDLVPIDSKRRQSSQATSTSAAPKKKRVLTQMHLDFGQKNFHSTQCAMCGFLYTPGKRDEERLHESHHAQAVGRHVIKFRTMTPPGSTMVAKDGKGGGQIYVVRGGGCPSGSGRAGDGGSGPGHKTILEVAAMLERELGMCEGWASAGVLGKGISMYMYVNGAKELVGCVVVEVDPVKARIGVVMDSEGKVEKRAEHGGSEHGTRAARAGDDGGADGHQDDACRHDGEGVLNRGVDPGGKKKKQCAVRVMWASKLHRRKKVVSALLDCVRGQLVPGQIIGRHDVAYSQPTRDGALFIASYSGRHRREHVASGIDSSQTEFWVYE